MRLGYTIIYVPDVAASLNFFERAFGLKTRFNFEGSYGELITGETTLSFASHTLGATNHPHGYVRADSSPVPLGMEIALVCDDVPAAYEKALQAGAKSLAEPAKKPWGQTVSWIRCPDGTLVEICAPVG